MAKPIRFLFHSSLVLALSMAVSSDESEVSSNVCTNLQQQAGCKVNDTGSNDIEEQKERKEQGREGVYGRKESHGREEVKGREEI